MGFCDKIRFPDLGLRRINNLIVNLLYPFRFLLTSYNFQGFLFPALHALTAHWAPPAEKGKFISSLLGGAIGTVVTWSLTGPVIEAFGWDYAFYIPGTILF